jgi:hypothetical protein
MKEQKLRFEVVGDITVKYCYICIYDDVDTIQPFMEIGISDDKQLVYTIYKNDRNVAINTEDWDKIASVAKEFLPEEIAREESCEQWIKEMGYE